MHFKPHRHTLDIINDLNKLEWNKNLNNKFKKKIFKYNKNLKINKNFINELDQIEIYLEEIINKQCNKLINYKKNIKKWHMILIN